MVQEIQKRAFARPALWPFVLVGAAALAVLLSIYGRIYSPAYGLTRLIIIGSEFNRRGLAVYQATPKYIDPYPLHRLGFDGQQYAQIALDPLLRDPQIKTAIDNPPYRARRILLSWLAWLGGLGRPFWILNVYAALNFVFWLGFAVMMTVVFRPYGWAGLAGFAAMLLTCGVIASMWASLADFPGFVLMTLAVLVGGSGGAGVLALAALARETSLLGLAGLWEFKPPWRESRAGSPDPTSLGEAAGFGDPALHPITSLGNTAGSGDPALQPTASSRLRQNLRLGLIAAVPMAFWFAYVAWRLRMAATVSGDNLDWPLRGIMAKLGEFSVATAQGHIRWHRWYLALYESRELHALLTIVALLTQCLYVCTHRAWNNRLWRVAALFVLFFLCIGYPSWENHFTITRHALPITLAFNLLLAMRPGRAWFAWFLLGNCFVPFGIYRFYHDLGPNGATPPPPAEYRVVNPPFPSPAVSVRFDQGWSDLEWNAKEGWRWATQQPADVLITNPTREPLEAELSFVVQSVILRELQIEVRQARLWSGLVSGSARPVRPSRFLLPPGATRVSFRTPQPPAPSEPPDDRLFFFKLQDLQIRLTVPPAGVKTSP